VTEWYTLTRSFRVTDVCWYNLTVSYHVCHNLLQDSTSDIADQSGHLSPETGGTKANVISPSKNNLQGTAHVRGN